MSNWISVKDRLPEEITELVLVGRVSIPAVMAARLIDGKFMVSDMGRTAEFVEPTHWSLLPPPPEDKP